MTEKKEPTLTKEEAAEQKKAEEALKEQEAIDAERAKVAEQAEKDREAKAEAERKERAKTSKVTKADIEGRPGALTPTADDIELAHAPVKAPKDLDDGGGDPADGGGDVHLFSEAHTAGLLFKKAEAREDLRAVEGLQAPKRDKDGNYLVVDPTVENADRQPSYERPEAVFGDLLTDKGKVVTAGVHAE